MEMFVHKVPVVNIDPILLLSYCLSVFLPVKRIVMFKLNFSPFIMSMITLQASKWAIAQIRNILHPAPLQLHIRCSVLVVFLTFKQIIFINVLLRTLTS